MQYHANGQSMNEALRECYMLAAMFGSELSADKICSIQFLACKIYPCYEDMLYHLAHGEIGFVQSCFN